MILQIAAGVALGLAFYSWIDAICDVVQVVCDSRGSTPKTEYKHGLWWLGPKNAQSERDRATQRETDNLRLIP